MWLYRDLVTHPALQYLAWISLPVLLVLFAAGFVHILAPQAIGKFDILLCIIRSYLLLTLFKCRTIIVCTCNLMLCQKLEAIRQLAYHCDCHTKDYIYCVQTLPPSCSIYRIPSRRLHLQCNSLLLVFIFLL